MSVEIFRTFVGLRTYNAVKELKDIVTTIDDCLEEFRLPSYYRDPSFHVSVCWAVGDVKANIPNDVLDNLQVIFKSTQTNVEFLFYVLTFSFSSRF